MESNLITVGLALPLKNFKLQVNINLIHFSLEMHMGLAITPGLYSSGITNQDMTTLSQLFALSLRCLPSPICWSVLACNLHLKFTELI